MLRATPINQAPYPEAALRPAHRLANYAFVDYATQGYLALVALLVLCFHGTAVPHWRVLVLGHASAIIAIHWLIRRQSCPQPGRLVEFLRHFYPVLLYAGLFRETGELNQMFVTGYLDAFFIRLEQQIFGGQPGLTFMAALPFAAVSELFYAAYFSYYIMIGGVGLALFFRSRAQFLHYVAMVSFMFYVCYLAYIFLPVVGPRIFLGLGDSAYPIPADVLPAEIPADPAAVRSGVFYQVMALIYRVFEMPGAAFPSSHVAVAIGTLYFSWRYLRGIRVLHLGAVLLLCLATVYGHYHYVLDVVAGVATAATLIPLGNWCYSRFSRSESTRRA